MTKWQLEAREAARKWRGIHTSQDIGIECWEYGYYVSYCKSRPLAEWAENWDDHQVFRQALAEYLDQA